MDMKEGLQIVGETLEENVAGAAGNKSGSAAADGSNGNGGESKNFFLLDTTELDAMMSILKKEVDGLAEAPDFGSSTRDKGESNSNGNGNDNATVTSSSDDIPPGIGYPPQSGFNIKQNKSIFGAGSTSVSNISMGSSAPLTGGKKTQKFGSKRFFGNFFSRG